MVLAIIPFLIQWLALSQFDVRRAYTSQQSHPYQEYYSQTPYQSIPGSFPPKTQWTLLSDFQRLPEEEIEAFLPQICNMVLDRDAYSDPAVFDYFENLIVNKCAECFPFGSRVCGLLKVGVNVLLVYISILIMCLI